MEAQIIEEEELQSYMPGGVEICITTSEIGSMIESGEVIEVETTTEPEDPMRGEEVEVEHPIETIDIAEGDYQGHEEEEESSVTYECDKCGLLLTRKSTYDLHMKEVHVDEAYYACEFCPATAIHWSEYYVHQCTNMDNKPLQCPHCQRTVSTKKQLSAHEEIHALQRRFTTKKLDHYFARKLEEAEDPAIDWGIKPFICGICGRPFAKMYEVEYHEKLHSEERTSPNECSNCHIRYLNKNDLNKHTARGCSNEYSRKIIHKPTID